MTTLPYLSPLDQLVLGYIRERSRVTSVHKLPTQDEIAVTLLNEGFFLGTHDALTDSLIYLTRVVTLVRCKGPYYYDAQIKIEELPL